jgi:hypothetical protein
MPIFSGIVFAQSWLDVNKKKAHTQGLISDLTERDQNV